MCLEQREKEGRQMDVAEMLESLAAAASQLQHWHVAAHLVGAASSVRKDTRPLRTPQEETAYVAMLMETQQALGEIAFGLAWEHGKAASWQNHLAEAQVALVL